MQATLVLSIQVTLDRFSLLPFYLLTVLRAMIGWLMASLFEMTSQNFLLFIF
jgi:hypothetical protein